MEDGFFPVDCFFQKTCLDEDEEDTRPKNKKHSSKLDSITSKEWLTRVRGQVAKASRKSRQKRKQQENLVYEENKRLKKEREQQLQHIAELEEKIRETQNAVSEKDQRFIHQNELLRVQIEQHRLFYLKYLKLIDSTPEQNQVDINLSKIELEGLEFSFLYIKSLLSSSATDNWLPVTMDDSLFYTITPGREINGSFKFVPSKRPRMNFRMDLVVRLPSDYSETHKGIDPVKVCMKGVWDFWGSEKHVKQYFPLKQDLSIKKINIRSKDTSFEEYQEGSYQDIDDNVCAYYYHEQREKEMDRGWMYLVTKRLTECANSTLLLPSHLSPSFSNSLGKKSLKRKRRSNSKKNKARDNDNPYGTTKAWMMTRSTVQHVPNEVHEKLGVKKGLQNIRPSLIEGAVVWEEECIQPSEEDHLLETFRTVRCAYLLSMSDDTGTQIINGYQDVMNLKGVLKPHICRAIERSHLRMRDDLGLSGRK
mmetsp:Transcript_5890/g.6774  ORF Transcript_5890/g.6774 Transcript_5890/m.6774 type:complete len:478 (-) Transcript_5890:159-1592(-)